MSQDMYNIFVFLKEVSTLWRVNLRILLHPVYILKQSHNTPIEAQGERMYSSYSFTISALDGSEWSASNPVYILVLQNE
jgi:hypothetical protein